ncbi:hypothetical protein EDD70_2334 [Hydrogenoanaerobacterium saccharovorans]|uniref:Uncharacterized protein n=1 Tax=Hydrogenoanaerobacterium saccharovorans TaxID=474960 RepID=A0A1H8CXX0_9FIRM|nr:DUF6550 family protein [Hydrogenoanaerobacterium saccharovorans]RPF43370.1 hypothetical protein EDD70_2334 [Hydrogenoanaerobacterium saccharovorans]SEM99722.1 hypothetical protein SAMN05216180_2392 [Hydrogenoanaerobacterium saccharovorans]
MTKKTKIIVTALAAIVVVFAGVGIYMLTKDSPFIVDPVHVLAEEAASEPTSKADDTDDQEYKVPPIVVTPPAEKTIKDTKNSTPEENTEVVTKNPDGTKTTEIVRPEFEKPEPPAPPEVDEKEAMDPEKPPEYTPEQKKPNKEPKKPTGGESNNKGEIYVPGFGWQKPVENTFEVAENAGTGEVIGY